MRFFFKKIAFMAKTPLLGGFQSTGINAAAAAKTGILIILSIIFISCSEINSIKPVEEDTLLFEMPGLVDSAVVYGCYSYTSTYVVPDTFALSNYTKIKIEFDGQANSDGTIIFVVLFDENGQGNEIYRAENISGINRIHSFETLKPYNMALMKVRLYINPPVCGQNEFKYNRVRDLKVYGVR